MLAPANTGRKSAPSHPGFRSGELHYSAGVPDPYVLSPDGPAPGPFSALLGFRYVSVDEHEAVVEADPGPEHCNGGGIVHGGFLSALLDTTTGWAVHARLPAGAAAPHVQLSVQYVRAAVPGGAGLPWALRRRRTTDLLGGGGDHPGRQGDRTRDRQPRGAVPRLIDANAPEASDRRQSDPHR
ncbi:MAG: PaaI family thioesterase [Marmoricola sp.]|nr:PaaI family thioesterase [Marmoricola sp.]